MADRSQREQLQDTDARSICKHGTQLGPSSAAEETETPSGGDQFKDCSFFRWDQLHVSVLFDVC